MHVCRAFLLSLFTLVPLSAYADNITLVVGFAAGGTSSSAARVILEPLSRVSGKRVLVENRPGAGGLIAAKYVASQRPEQGVLLFMSSSSAVRVPAELGLVPVALVATYEYVIVRRGDSALDEYFAAARKDRSLQSVGTPGAGSTPHLFMAKLFREREVPMLHVPYQGGAPAILAVLAGEVALAAVPYPDFLGFKDTLSILAKTGNGFSTGGWMGVFAPPGTTPQEVVRLASWLQVASEASKDAFARIGFAQSYRPGNDLGRIYSDYRAELFPELDLQGVKF
jgi:tripartite-type tricarboxylate transporter receptor subunit TctC